jgi:integrase
MPRLLPEQRIVAEEQGFNLRSDVEPPPADLAEGNDAGLAAMRARPEPITFHDLRHTFGTLAVRAFLLSDVKAYMGHTDVQTTMI